MILHINLLKRKNIPNSGIVKPLTSWIELAMHHMHIRIQPIHAITQTFHSLPKLIITLTLKKLRTECTYVNGSSHGLYLPGIPVSSILLNSLRWTRKYAARDPFTATHPILIPCCIINSAQTANLPLRILCDTKNRKQSEISEDEGSQGCR